MSSHGNELPLPRYGLGGAFVDERWGEGEGWDLCETVHRPTGSDHELDVTVIRRTTARRDRGGPRVAISPGEARENVANALVVPIWRTGDEDIFAVIKRVANDERAWRTREIVFDGQRVVGHEREYEGKWVLYHLTPTLIVLVAAPVALRPENVELRKLRHDEIASSDECTSHD